VIVFADHESIESISGVQPQLMQYLRLLFFTDLNLRRSAGGGGGVTAFGQRSSGCFRRGDGFFFLRW